MWIFNRLLIIVIITGTVSACSPGSYDWESWGGCSKTCGGGSRSRVETSCVWGIDGDTDHGGCEQWCYHGHSYSGGRCRCPSWRSGSCCLGCRHITIPHCKPNKQQCGGSPDNIKCTDCYDPYFSSGFVAGNAQRCQECKRIANCQERHCTRYSHTRCSKCVDDNIFFVRREDDTKCERKCAWNNYFCWPGTCGDSLTKKCNCSDGFNLFSNISETSCQPSKRPSIETCFTNFVDSHGDKKQSQSSTSSTECQYYQDIYGSFQVKTIDYDFLTDFIITLPTLPKPAFIKESNFGVTDATIYLEKILLSGKTKNVGIHRLLEDKAKSTLANRTYATKGSISTSSDEFSLQNGEWLCALYESRGGGYIRSIDTSKSTHVELQPIPYQKNNTTKSICYRYDDEPPVHCKAMNTCSTDPLFIKDKATRLREIPVYFDDWFDPSPSSTDRLRASSIESYQITIHETILSMSKVQIDLGDIGKTKVNYTVKSAVLSLPSDSPRLYCIELEVKDVADNVRRARRFILYDNTSFIEKSSIHPIYVKSASAKTNYVWQTHHNEICVDWKEHFFNKEYQDESPLNPIEPDHSGIITGVYEQIDGFLPVTGTQNVHGIVKFEYTWGLNNNTLSKDIIVPNLFNQSYCKHFDLKDGESYTMKVVAVDIANNTCDDNTTVHIDRSVPHIQNIWLQKDNLTRLFVHDSKELSTMSLYFEVIDPHSGILNVNWSLGTTDSGTELLTGILKPQFVNNSTCTTNSTTCYCPDIGYCESFNYRVPLENIVSANKKCLNHNHKYYFSIKATNNALLANIEHVNILVSNPESACSDGCYGYKCEVQCGYCTGDTVCNKISGFCEDGCTAGYKGKLCIEECDDGMYGESCAYECGYCLNETYCDKINGSCSFCAEGFIGTQCRDLQSHPSDRLPSAVIGIAAGGVFFIALAIIGVIVFLKKRKGQTSGENESIYFTDLQHNISEAGNEYYTFLAKKSDLKLCQLWDYINQKKRDENVLFYQEFNLLPSGLQHPHNVAMISKHRPKNRFRGFCAYDHCRVPLRVEETEESEYINASFIDGVKETRKFIASQGPTETMRTDFLRMIRQHNVTQVVMLTSLMEQGTDKCLIYWPESKAQDETYGNNTVRLVSEDMETGYVIRHLRIRKNSDPWRDITQYHFKSWPEKDVPDSTWTLVKFWRKVMEDTRDQSGPILVHCSAGVGRTGTFIALDNAFHHTSSSGVLKMLEILAKLRYQRVNMVQTKDQYVFLHEALADALYLGTQCIWPRDYSEIYDYMMKIDPKTREQRLETQFNLIEQSIDVRKQLENENHETNDREYSNICAQTIKREAIISSDEYMPKSKSKVHVNELGTVLLPNFKGENVFIVTKSPTKATLAAVWSLIAKQNIKIVVTIQGSSADHAKTSFSIGETDTDIKFPFGVHLVEELTNENYCQKQLAYNSTEGSLNVSQFTYKSWDNTKAIPKDSKSMIEFLEAVLNKERRLSPTQPVLIHCGDDLERSGLVCVLLAELDRMKQDEGHINILQSVKMMKERNETIIPSFEQYKYVYDAIQSTFYKDDMYANC